MRVKLILSFALVLVVSLLGTLILVRRNAQTAVRAFMVRGNMTGPTGLVTLLEDYYTENGSWDGVESLLQMPMHNRPAETTPGGTGHGYGGQGQGLGQGSNSGQGMGNSGMAGSGMMMGQRLRLTDADGHVLYDSQGVTGPAVSSSARRSGIELQVGGRTVGYLLAEGSIDTAQESYLLNRMMNAAVTAGLIAAGLSLLLAFALAYGVMRPVRVMTKAAYRLGEGDLSQRVPEGGDDELRALAHTFNNMAGSLQQAEESRRALTADIAHELRTPLSVQRAHLEALQDGIYPLTAENLAPILEQTLLLSRLVDDLRTLALADAGQITLERTPVDLASLVQRIAGRFCPQAEKRGIDIKVDTGSGLMAGELNLDPQRIEQILGNLLSNALRYTPDGGSINLAVSYDAKSARVTVQDSGPGIPPESLERVFDRFYRVDKSRSRQEGGAGLGLAIARRLVEAHGGSLTAINAPQGGAVFTMTLPK